VRGINQHHAHRATEKDRQWFQDLTQIGQLRADLAPWFGQQLGRR
jgi:hypothetical protein